LSEFDYTDYVDIAARAHVAENTIFDWDKLPEEVKFTFREQLLASVTAVIEKYRENHPSTDWLDGIG
jgi:hypothetical protein